MSFRQALRLTSRHRRLFELVARRPVWTRWELAQVTGWSAATVWQLSRDLVNAGLVRVEGPGPSRGGRRPLLFSLAGDDEYLAVVRVGGAGRLELRWYNMEGRGGATSCDQAVVPTEAVGVQTGLVATLAHLVDAQRSTLPPPARVVGVAVILPGLVDREGRLLFSSPLGLREVPVAAELGRLLHLPVVCGNDVDLAALGESRWGGGRAARRLLYLWADQGIGLGMVFDGELYLGSRSSAGELGHFTVDPSGAPCRCGNRGCLGMTASELGLVGQASRLVWVDQQTELRRLTGGDLNRVSLGQLAQAVAAGDHLAGQVVDQALDHLGLALANLVNLLGPDLILVAGSVFWMDPERVLRRLQEAVDSHSLPFFREGVRIEPAPLGEEARFLGAVSLFREQLAGALWSALTATGGKGEGGKEVCDEVARVVRGDFLADQ